MYSKGEHNWQSGIQCLVKARYGAQVATLHGNVNYHSCVTLEEAREIVIDGIDYAAYRETDVSLHDSDKNLLFGSEHYKSDRHVIKASPWSVGKFEETMAMLL